MAELTAEEAHQLGDRFAEASYKYLHMYAELVIHSLKHDGKRKFPRWSPYGLIHDMEQCLTEIQMVYNGENIVKWGCKNTEEVIGQMLSSAQSCLKRLEKLEKENKE